jgi:hypothetical protein
VDPRFTAGAAAVQPRLDEQYFAGLYGKRTHHDRTGAGRRVKLPAAAPRPTSLDRYARYAARHGKVREGAGMAKNDGSVGLQRPRSRRVRCKRGTARRKGRASLLRAPRKHKSERGRKSQKITHQMHSPHIKKRQLRYRHRTKDSWKNGTSTKRTIPIERSMLVMRLESGWAIS